MQHPFSSITLLFLMISFTSNAQEVPKKVKNARALSISFAKPLNFEKRKSEPSLNKNFKLTPNSAFGIGFHKNYGLEDKFGFAINYHALYTTAISLPDDYVPGSSLAFGRATPLQDFQHSFSLRWTYSKKIVRNVIWIPEIGPSFNIIGLVKFIPSKVMSEENYEESIDLSYLPGISCLNRISFLASKSFALDLFVHVNLNSKFSYTTIGTQFNFGRTNKEKS